MSEVGGQGLPYGELGVRRPAVEHYDIGMKLLEEAGPMEYGTAKYSQLAQATAWFLAGLLKTQIDAAGDSSSGGWG